MAALLPLAGPFIWTSSWFICFTQSSITGLKLGEWKHKQFFRPVPQELYFWLHQTPRSATSHLLLVFVCWKAVENRGSFVKLKCLPPCCVHQAWGTASTRVRHCIYPSITKCLIAQFHTNKQEINLEYNLILYGPVLTLSRRLHWAHPVLCWVYSAAPLEDH